jgi:hypothetical protein
MKCRVIFEVTEACKTDMVNVLMYEYWFIYSYGTLRNMAHNYNFLIGREYNSLSERSSKLAKAVTHLICIQNASGSNRGQDTNWLRFYHGFPHSVQASRQRLLPPRFLVLIGRDQKLTIWHQVAAQLIQIRYITYDPSILSGDFVFSIGFEVLKAVVVKNCIFWDTAPCSPLKVNRRREQSLLATRVMLVSCYSYSSTLKIATFSSETSVDFQWTSFRLHVRRFQNIVFINWTFVRTETSPLTWSV